MKFSKEIILINQLKYKSYKKNLKFSKEEWRQKKKLIKKIQKDLKVPKYK